MRAIFFLAVLSLLAGCGETPLLDIREIDGVPVLMQNGMPYFTRLARTDHDVIDLSGIWKFRTDPANIGITAKWFTPDLADSTWFDHPVPGAWNQQKPEWSRYVGVGWYRRHFDAPKEWQGRFNRLVIDGADNNARVWLNGIRIGGHRGGYAQFSVDATRALNYGGDNVLVIRVDNRRNYESLPPLTGRDAPLGWWPWGGLTRPLSLESGPQTTLCKLAVDADHLGNLEGSGVIYRHGHTETQALVTVRLLDREGLEIKLLLEWPVTIGPTGIAVFRFKEKLEGAKPWSPQEPQNRYLVEVEVKDAEAKEKQAAEFGFRTFEFRGGKAWLNGRPIFLRGVNRHEDDHYTGPAQTEDRIMADLALIGNLNANFVRGAHYPNDPRWLDACDRRGLLVMTEIPLYEVARSWKSLRAVEEPVLHRQAALALIEMIERDRNHPAVIIWGMGNGAITVFPSVKKLYGQLYTMSKRFDPHRPAVFATTHLPFGVSSMLDSSGEVGDAIFINEYTGWYYGEAEDAGFLLDQLHQRWPTRAVVVSETGAGAVAGGKPGAGRKVWMWHKRDYSEAYQAALFRKKLPLYRARPFVAGACAWVLADFPDDSMAAEPVANFNLKGLCRRDRKPKLAFGALAQLYAEIERKEAPAMPSSPPP